MCAPAWRQALLERDIAAEDARMAAKLEAQQKRRAEQAASASEFNQLQLRRKVGGGDEEGGGVVWDAVYVGAAPICGRWVLNARTLCAALAHLVCATNNAAPQHHLRAVRVVHPQAEAKARSLAEDAVFAKAWQERVKELKLEEGAEVAQRQAEVRAASIWACLACVRAALRTLPWAC